MTEIHKHGGDIYRHKNVLDFSSNCNPYGTPEGVKKAGAAAMELVCHYPDVECLGLRRALAEAEGVPIKSIICGNGAADLIFGLALALKPGIALLPAPTFAEYEQALRAWGCETEYYFLSEEEGFCPGEGFLDHIGKDTDMVFFCNPNNPTGVAVEPEYLKKLAHRCRETETFLVLDECFEDFLEEPQKYSMKRYLKEYPQMFLLKAFTKKYAMAGIRLGYGFCGNPQILEKMKEVMQPWNVSVVAQEAGMAALKEETYVKESMKKIRKEREILLEGMKKLGFFTFASEANYIFFKGPEDLQEKCLEKGIYIRDCSNYRGLRNGYYRVAVRTGEENEELLKVFKQILEQNR